MPCNMLTDISFMDFSAWLEVGTAIAEALRLQALDSSWETRPMPLRSKPAAAMSVLISIRYLRRRERCCPASQETVKRVIAKS